MHLYNYTTERTNWSFFFEPDIETYTNTVLCYIKTYIENITTTKQNPFRSGDGEQYSTARHILKKDIKLRLLTGRRTRFQQGSSMYSMWQGIQHITNYRAIQQPPPDNNTNLAEELNHFFACFEMAESDNRAGCWPPLWPYRHTSEEDLQHFECEKDWGTRWNSRESDQRLHQPETVLKTHLIQQPANLDQHQYAYRVHWSTEDAIASVLHIALTCLHQKGTCVRILLLITAYSIQYHRPQLAGPQTAWPGSQ